MSRRRLVCLLVAVALCAALPAAAPSAAAPAEAPSKAATLRTSLADETLYFVLPDRFDNGQPSNDRAGISGTSLDHGHDPGHKAYYHGGDLEGVRKRLDYLERMGVTAIWMAPIFRNKPVQFDGRNFSAGYHGYWITDFLNVDPHFGTNAELKALIEDAHARGMKVFFDIITNHTADVIDYDLARAVQTHTTSPNTSRITGELSAKATGRNGYREKTAFPYRDADGFVFDDRDYAGHPDFPELTLDGSFPYRPVFRSPEDATAKSPAWLNDMRLYHNRGDSTFAGENSEYGDFVGLDDLFTEHPQVVQGMIDIHKFWIREFGVDGFRIDTVKHVNMEFWQAFGPALLEYAGSLGKEDFFLFGEVFDGDPAFTSKYSTTGRLSASLDFPFAFRVRDFASQAVGTNGLRDLFRDDDYHTDADSDAGILPTFLGNHDMGRIGNVIQSRNRLAGDADWVARMALANALMFTARGVPIIYYGDEQGFTGDGGDQDARQDSMPSQVATYNDDDLIGTDATTASANFDEQHPLYRNIAELGALRRAHGALSHGAQLHRASGTTAGIYAFSRIDPDEKVEYVVALNNSTSPATATFATDTPAAALAPLHPAGLAPVSTDAAGQVTVTLPRLSAAVWRADRPIAASTAAPEIAFTAPKPASAVNGRTEISVALSSTRFSSVSFEVSVAGGGWQSLGTDRNAPYRVFFDTAKLPTDTPLRFRATVDDHHGHTAVTTVATEVGIPKCKVGDPNTMIFHYQRPAQDYAGWGLYMWNQIDPSEQTTWPANRPFTFTDSYGVWSCVKVQPGATNVGFIVQRNGVKDVEQDRFVNPSQTPEVWLRQGDPTIYTSPPG